MCKTNGDRGIQSLPWIDNRAGGFPEESFRIFSDSGRSKDGAVVVVDVFDIGECFCESLSAWAYYRFDAMSVGDHVALSRPFELNAGFGRNRSLPLRTALHPTPRPVAWTQE